MNTRSLAIAALVLWGISAIAIGIMIVRGSTTEGADGRTAIVLTEAEKGVVLGEMRHLLEAVQGVVDGVAQDDMAKVTASARAAGAAAAADVNPGLMTKLPLDFKQLGMGVHRGFDELADAAEQGESASQILNRLGGMLNTCVGCHATYSLQRAP